MKKNIYTFILGFLIITINISNIRGLLQNYYGFYFPENDAEKLETNKLYVFLSKIQETPIYNYFTTYTGFETGYGFFSPNVASDFVVDFILYDAKNNIISKVNFIPLENKESIVRLTSAYSIFLNTEKKDASKLEQEKSRILLKGLAYQNLIANSKASKIKANLYLYHYPTLEQMESQTLENPIMILNYSKTYTRKDYENWN